MATPSTLKLLNPNLSAAVQRIANTHRATVISFVAPQGVRTSPVTFTSAIIEESEIYRLEQIVKKASEKNATNCLHFVIHTPGGEMFAAYKIAAFLRSKFTKISAFVPYEAASGGTIFCCAADELYMGELGNLTSIDPQTRYKEHSRVSCYAIVRAVDAIEQLYGEMSPDELPSPWQQMAEKIDPVIHDHMNTTNFTAMVSASRLLQKSGYTKDNAWKIANSLGRNYYAHEFPLFAADAKEIGFTLKTDNDTMNVYAQLVSARLQEKFPRHAIDDFFPEPQTEGTNEQQGQ